MSNCVVLNPMFGHDRTAARGRAAYAHQVAQTACLLTGKRAGCSMSLKHGDCTTNSTAKAMGQETHPSSPFQKTLVRGKIRGSMLLARSHLEEARGCHLHETAKGWVQTDAIRPSGAVSQQVSALHPVHPKIPLGLVICGLF